MKNFKCLTGIKELDNILNGGLPARRFYLIQGDPGVGKTTLALQFLLQGVSENEKVLYISLSETEEEIRVIAESHGWSLDKVHIIDLSSIEENLSVEKQNTLFHPSEIELKQTIKLIIDNVKEYKPARVVFDSLAEIRLLAQNSLRYRRQMLGLKQYFSKLNCTVLLLDDRTAGQEDLQIQSIAHGVITLEKNILSYGVPRRQLHVDKIRGSTFQEGYHDFVILRGGLCVFPRLLSKQNKKEFPMQTVSTGIPEFDNLLGGGIERGTSNLLLGPPGVGKSTLAMRAALALAEKGEKVAIYCFDENVRTYLHRAKALGMDLEKYVKTEKVLIKQISVSELSPGEFAYQIKQMVESSDMRMVVIDSLNGYLNAMTDEVHLIVQLHELFSYLNHQAVI
ncbi:MAG: AAA family ATPase, partial [Candidatus Omnitrophica bacterium]|nr:AAA family ATPase [Candidatus Omnitrophota bacterium]